MVDRNTNSVKKDTASDRAPRSADSRAKEARPKPWQPPSLLDAPTPPPGHSGVIGVGGLLLAKMPIETVEQRRAYYNQMASEQMEAVDSNLMRESDGRMPISQPNRQSKVTFGRGGDS